MKTYEKPRLMAISLSGSDQLCGSCSAEHRTPVSGNEQYLGLLAMIIDLNKDNVVSKDEVEKCFGPGESCSFEVESGCKFSSSGTVTNIAWS